MVRDIKILMRGLDYETICFIEKISQGDKNLYNIGLLLALKHVALEVIEAGFKACKVLDYKLPEIRLDVETSINFNQEKSYVSPDHEFKILIIEILGKLAVEYRLNTRGFISTFQAFLSERKMIEGIGLSTELTDEELRLRLQYCEEIAQCDDWLENESFKLHVFSELNEKLKMVSKSIVLEQEELNFNKGQALPLVTK